MAAAIDTLQGRPRGGSTITQQLVRVRLLPEKYTDLNVDPYERKVREIIQAIRLTQAYPGPEGKRAIIEVYLNNNNYGNRSYGVAAAARAYWRKDLADLTLAECALLAGIPKAPTTFDLVRNAVEEPYTDEDGREQVRLVVPQTSAVVQRRNLVLDAMRKEARLTAGEYTAADYEAAKMEPVILAPQVTDRWKAPHFSWKVHDTLGQLLCGSDECELVDTGGFTVISTLDYRMQRITEKWVHAAAIIPNMKDPGAVLKARGIPRSEWSWIRGLRGHNIHNAAAGVMDYRTGEVLAYAGSASYTARRSRRLQPQFDVLGDGWRQPGSAIKPLGYLIGIDDRTMTAATMFMDVVTNFGGRYSPTQADHLERGPVRLRSALQFSLNIPAIKAGFINGLAHQYKRTKDFGLRYLANRHACRLREHRHPRGPPDRPDRRLWDHRERRRPDAPAHHPARARRRWDPGLAPAGLAAQGNARGLTRGRLHHHRHPGRQHADPREPLLGAVADHQRGHQQQGSAGGLQDRDDERQPRRPRLWLSRAPLQQEAAGARRGRLARQLRQLAERRPALP